MTQLKTWREKAGLTQAELGAQLGYSSAQFVSNIERGVSLLPPSKFKIASKVLGIPVEKFIEAKMGYYRIILRKSLRL